MRVLDVGSGPECLLPSKTTSDIIHLDLSKEWSHLEVQADAALLPFKDSCFDVVYASHLLEHVDNPLAILKEIKRVSRSLVVVRVPNEPYTNPFLNNECSPFHLYSWTENTLRRLLMKVFPRVEVQSVHIMSSRSEKNPITRKLLTLKTYVVAAFFRKTLKNEIVAKCRV